MNTTPIEIELTIFGFLDANTLYGINRASTQMAKARRVQAAEVIRRNVQRHLLLKRWFDEHDDDIEDSERLNRFAHKRFYPLAYRLSMMSLSLKKVLQDHDSIRSQVRALIRDSDRPLADRYNEYVDLLSHDMLINNGW